MSFYPSWRRPRKAIYEEVDPYYSQVSLLVTFDGTNGSTTFVDKSKNNFTLTAKTTAQISTDQSKFGGTSGKFMANGAYVSVPQDNSLFIPGDFTLESWIYPISPTTNPLGAERAIFGMWSAVDGNKQSYLLHLSNGSLRFVADLTNDDTVFNVTSTITSETWYHIVVMRKDSDFYCFVDGVPKGGTYVQSTTPIASTGRNNNFGIGGYNRESGATDASFYGYIDSIRLTKGVARYNITGFSVPTTDFPTLGPPS